MKTITRNKNFPFLKGGGEMGELTRTFNWSQTSLGNPDNWPQSLRQTVSILLHSRFPMFLWWGEELIQFYNDAYRPSLGITGKHPQALGQKGKDCWPEIWDIIFPLIKQVKESGEPTWMENQLIPIYRNGKLEDVYWTFSYSLVLNDDYAPGGVLVTCMETTETILSKKKIEESEARFRIMAESTDILIAVADETSHASYFNRAWINLTGRPLEDLLSFGWVDMVHPEDKENYLQIYLSAFEKKESFTGEFRIRNRDGDYHWLLAKGLPRFRNDNSFAGYISSCIDITDRKNYEQEIHESREKLRSLIKEAPVATCLFTGRDLVIELANEKMLNLWGKGQSPLGNPLAEALPELKDQSFLQILDEVFITGIPYEAKASKAILNVDGKPRTFYFDFTYKPLRNPGGEVYAIMDMAVDVTEQELSKLALEESERNLRNMILQAPVAMCILGGPSHIVEIANDRMIELWGRPASDMMHKPIFEGLPEAKGQGFEDMLYQVYTTGETVKMFELPVLLPRDGKLQNLYLNFVYEAFREGDGSISGIMAVAIEVTEQVLSRQKIEEVVNLRTQELGEANEALRISNHELKRSNQNLEEFAHAASHDLKEPVRKIHFFTHQLREQLFEQLKDSELKSFSRIENATQRMGKLIDDLLLYSHVSLRPLEMETIDLNQKLQRVLEDLELDIQEKNAIIRVGKLPAVKGYRRQLQQLFQNLISNALKYCKEDTIPEISITAEEKVLQGRKYDVINVRDNGIGFDMEYEEKIFKMFTRLHGRNEYSGTGVGLSIVKKVAENHDGFIRVESVPDEGSVFRVYLPVK